MLVDHTVLTNQLSEETGNYAIQLSGGDGARKNFLSVIAKRTYHILPNGICELHPSPDPLTTDFVFSDDNPDQLIADTDLYYDKPYTDLVVRGHCYPGGNQRTGFFQIEVSNQKQKLKVPVFGDRKAYINHYDKIAFTDPEPVEKLALEYANAYGGVDAVAEEQFELPPQEIRDALPDIDWAAGSPYRYARNTIGKGFVIEKDKRAFENLSLPNFEDEKQLLSPSNLLTGTKERWAFQPIPRCTTWVNPAWFPRLAYFGVLPELPNDIRLSNLPEGLQALVDPSILNDLSIMDKMSARAANGASLGLQYPYLYGSETIRMLNLHSSNSDFQVQLPKQTPRIWIDGRKGKLLETKPVIQTILIEPDKNKLTVVWRGSGAALRPYMDEELTTMPFKVEWK